jgi:hypothetical protein
MRMGIPTAALKVSPARQGLSTAAGRTRPVQTTACAPAPDWTEHAAQRNGRAPASIRTPGGSPDCAVCGLRAKKKPGVLAPALKMLQEKTNEEKMEARLHRLHFQGEAYQLHARGHISRNPQNRRGNLRRFNEPSALHYLTRTRKKMANRSGFAMVRTTGARRYC